MVKDPQIVIPDSQTAWDERFVIASSETGGQVVYIPLGKHNPLLPAHPLVESALQKPLAVAVDGLNALLYVADSVARKVFRFRLAVRDVDGEAKLSASADGFVAENVEAVGVAVDSAGGVYFVDGGEGTHRCERQYIYRRQLMRMVLLRLRANALLTGFSVCSGCAVRSRR